MNVTVGQADTASKEPVVCGFVAKGRDYIAGLGAAVGPAAAQAAAETRGETGRTGMVIDRARRIIAAGMGGGSDEELRQAAAAIVLRARDAQLKSIAFVPPGDAARMAECITEGALLASYTFERFKTKKARTAPNTRILAHRPASINDAVKKAKLLARAVNYARDIANMPPNECAPEDLARMAKNLCTGARLECKILGPAALKKEGFGGIMAVGKGSSNGPRLIMIRYNGAGGKRPSVIVGKAVTFDTGGISLKPGEKMDQMKFDKCGGCAVLGVIKAAADLKLKKDIIGLIPAVENMPGADSYRPGDIIRLYGGHTAEILNTDAEGRLILADAISYAEKYNPIEIIDLATLTGACVVALGPNVAGLFSNDEDLASRLEAASQRTAERIWRLPLDSEYTKLIDSDVADVKNMGPGRVAGAVMAAAFLERALKKSKWAHLDIAGVAWTQIGTAKKHYNPDGASGFGVRLLVDYLQ